MHPPSRREGDGVNCWAVACGHAPEGLVEEGIDRVVEIARRGGVAESDIEHERAGRPQRADCDVQNARETVGRLMDTSTTPQCRITTPRTWSPAHHCVPP